ncbi:hypothetical protein [Heyndrickxia oleronia]|uniref:hypothetical protein n=1 Tax=Heyndrickxia oleronia TaxID=38875 RepID=UPI0037521E1C
MITALIRMGSLLAWSTAFFIPKKSLKKYLPVTIFSTLITVTVSFIGHHYNFWGLRGSSRKRMWNLLSIIAYFSIGCLWIFHLTFGKLKLYLLINLLNNFVYAYLVIPLFEKLNFITYVKFKKIHHVIVAMIYSLLIYGYQLIYKNPD